MKIDGIFGIFLIMVSVIFAFFIYLKSQGIEKEINIELFKFSIVTILTVGAALFYKRLISIERMSNKNQKIMETYFSEIVVIFDDIKRLRRNMAASSSANGLVIKIRNEKFLDYYEQLNKTQVKLERFRRIIPELNSIDGVISSLIELKTRKIEKYIRSVLWEIERFGVLYTSQVSLEKNSTLLEFLHSEERPGYVEAIIDLEQALVTSVNETRFV